MSLGGIDVVNITKELGAVALFSVKLVALAQLQSITIPIPKMINAKYVFVLMALNNGTPFKVSFIFPSIIVNVKKMRNIHFFKKKVVFRSVFDSFYILNVYNLNYFWIAIIINNKGGGFVVFPDFKKNVRIFIFLLLLFSVIFTVFISYYYVPFTLGIENTGYGVNKLNTPSSFMINVSEGLKNDPKAFGNLYADFPVNKYFISTYKEVSFLSERDNVMISGWLMMKTTSEPTIIVIHGLWGSKAGAQCLIQAGMLYRNGFNVLMIDLRNHGKSGNTGFYSAGILESYDVLAAIKWLNDTYKIETKNIGLVGNLMGAMTGAIAFVRNLDIAGIFLESPASGFKRLIDDEINYRRWPQFIKYFTVLTTFYGFSADEIEPLDAVKYANM